MPNLYKLYNLWYKQASNTTQGRQERMKKFYLYLKSSPKCTIKDKILNRGVEYATTGVKKEGKKEDISYLLKYA